LPREKKSAAGSDASGGGQNFLRVALVALTGGLREALDALVENDTDGVSKAVCETARRGRLLEKWALAKFGVDVAAEREDAWKKMKNKNFPFDDADEDAPVVVELSEGTYARMDISSVSEEADVFVTETAESGEPGARMGWMVQ
jgi:hypothetical protein